MKNIYIIDFRGNIGLIILCILSEKYCLKTGCYVVLEFGTNRKKERSSDQCQYLKQLRTYPSHN